MVIASLMEGDKKPHEIEKDLYKKARKRYNKRHDLSKDQKEHQVKKETIKIRYIEDILNDLKSKGQVAQRKRYGKYSLTERIIENPQFVANIFGKNAISKLKKMNALSNSPFVNFDDSNLEIDYSDAELIFRFANNVGAFITYVMLDAMNPDNMKRLEKGSDKDEFVLKKIRNAIDTHKLLEQFCKIKTIKRGLAVYIDDPISESRLSAIRNEIRKVRSSRRLFDPKNPNWSAYEMDRENYRRAVRSFAVVYPQPYELLEELTNRMPSIIQGYRRSYVDFITNDRTTRRKNNVR